MTNDTRGRGFGQYFPDFRNFYVVKAGELWGFTFSAFVAIAILGNFPVNSLKIKLTKL
jgi:hypothetical protein